MSGYNRTLNVFMNKYEERLETEFKFPDVKFDIKLTTVGKPSKEFSDLKNTIKSKIVKNMVNNLFSNNFI